MRLILLDFKSRENWHAQSPKYVAIKLESEQLDVITQFFNWTDNSRNCQVIKNKCEEYGVT